MRQLFEFQIMPQSEADAMMLGLAQAEARRVAKRRDWVLRQVMCECITHCFEVLELRIYESRGCPDGE